MNACVMREAIMSSKLSVPPPQHISAIDKLLQDKRTITKQLDVISEELADYYGQSLVPHIMDSPTPTSVPVVVYHKSGADLKFLIRAADAVLLKYPTAVVYLSGDDNITAASSNKNNKAADTTGTSGKGNKKKSAGGGENNTDTPSTASAIPTTPPSSTSKVPIKATGEVIAGEGNGPFILFGSPTMVNTAKSSLLKIVDGRGGGRPGRLQGQATKIGDKKLSEIQTLLTEISSC